MSSNRSALDALTQEGITMTDEQLLGETQKTVSNRNGATPTQTKGLVAYSDGISPTMTTGHTNPSSGRPHGRSVQARPAASAFPGATGVAQLETRRGRQRTPKPWLMAALCRLGMHEGQWAYVAEGNCTQGRKCGRCGYIHVRTKHQREWRYIREGTCEQVRSCGRCNAANGERTSHEWGETWEPETRWWQSSKGAHRCLRCGEVEEWTVNDGD